MQRRPLAVLAGAVFVLAACNALTGVGDLGIGPTSSGEGGSGEGGPGGADSGGGGDGSALDDGGGGPGDAAIPVITPSLAACGNERVCLADTGGWSPALQPLSPFLANCPAEWPTKTAAKRSGGGRCDCKCSPDVDTCGGGIAFRTGATCTGAPVTADFATDGGCVASSVTVPNPASLSSNGTPPKACTAAVVDNLDHSPDDVITCAGAATTMSTSCKAGEVCVPKPAPGNFGLPSASLCMAHDGEANCPVNLPIRVVTGSGIADGRTCSPACACAPRTSCNGGTVESFTNATCTGASRKYDVNGACAMVTSNNPLGYRYTTDRGCAITTPAQVVGKETIANARTFCCTTPF